MKLCWDKREATDYQKVGVLACRGVRSIQKRECEMVAYFWLGDEVADAIIH